MRRAIADADDVLVVTTLVRSALHRDSFVAAEDSPLGALTSRERFSRALPFAAGWDAGGIAEAMRSRPRRVQAHMLRASQLAPEREWRAPLADQPWGGGGGEAFRPRRPRRTTPSLAAAAVLTTLVGVVVAVVRVATAPPPLPPTAHGHGLLPWAPRGMLA